MHVTTVRFNADQWAAIVREAERLGIAKSAFVRDAVIFYLGHRSAEDRIGRLEDRLGLLGEQVQRLALTLTRALARKVPHAG